MNKNKVGILPKIIIGISMIIILAIGTNYMIEAFTGDGTLSFFTRHFMIPIVLVIIGGIAIFLPMTAQKTLSGDDKGDNMMYGVGILLFVCAIIALATSFI